MNVAALIYRAARQHADRVAVIDGERQLRFRDVDERSNRMVNALLGLGLQPGDRVAVLMPNIAEMVDVEFAAAKARLVRVLLNTRLTPEEHRYILADSGARVLVTTPAFVDAVMAYRSDLPDLQHIVVTGRAPAGLLAYGNLLQTARPAPPGLSPEESDPLMIRYTSGTTGRPKGAVTTQKATVAAMVNMLTDELSAGPADAMLHVGPLTHGSGSKTLAYFVRGATNVLLPRWDPELFAQNVQRHHGTATFMVPTMINQLLNAPEVDRYDVSTMRHVTYGGAPLPTAVAEPALQRFGQIFVQVYGSCEAPHPVLLLGRREHGAGGTPEERAVLRSAGREVVGVMVRIVDADGNDVPDGTPGELWVRGGNVMSGYWRRPEATAEVLVDGWYRTGDVVRRDESTYITFVDRIREMVKSGGLNVYPAEVEEVLYRHPAVLEAAVFGVPHPLWGEAVTAAVALHPGTQATEAELIAHCQASLASYKKPTAILFLPTLPKGSSGKILKRELRSQVMA